VVDEAPPDEIKTTLPPNIEVVPVYDRTELVTHVIQTVKGNLFEGGLLVVAVLFLFLGNLRAALIVALAIPLSMLFAFSGMLRFGISASLLSLGAIDFGMIVDSSVVMVENCVRHIAHGANRHRPLIDVIRDAAVEFASPRCWRADHHDCLSADPHAEGIEGGCSGQCGAKLFVHHRLHGVVAHAHARSGEPAFATADRRAEPLLMQLPMPSMHRFCGSPCHKTLVIGFAACAAGSLR
jgi:hypothetical protein